MILMGRRASREMVMKLLYQLEIQREDREHQIEFALNEFERTENDDVYIREVLIGVQGNISYIDKLIEKNSKGWKLNRISRVDLAILRVSIFEISFMEAVPNNVSINEAVDLAKKFSSIESSAYINGVLGNINRARLVPLNGNVSGNQRDEIEDDEIEVDKIEVGKIEVGKIEVDKIEEDKIADDGIKNGK
jgi:N utilization substance protein B